MQDWGVVFVEDLSLISLAGSHSLLGTGRYTQASDVIGGVEGEGLASRGGGGGCWNVAREIYSTREVIRPKIATSTADDVQKFCKSSGASNSTVLCQPLAKGQK
jgi:hypothetical protein